jgi:hypothetical protein
MQIDFAAGTDIEAMADLLHELFTLESDFQPQRAKQLGALRWILDHPAHGRLFVLRDAGGVVGMANALISISTAEGGAVLILEDVIFGAGCGVLTWVIRTWAGYPEGVAFAVLLMNSVTPIIDSYVRPRIYGRDRRGVALEPEK